jgi:hypothetical protein
MRYRAALCDGAHAFAPPHRALRRRARLGATASRFATTRTPWRHGATASRFATTRTHWRRRQGARTRSGPSGVRAVTVVRRCPVRLSTPATNRDVTDPELIEGSACCADIKGTEETRAATRRGCTSSLSRS